MLKRISIFWVILAALAITSAVPVGLIAFLEVSASQDEFEREAREKLMERTRGQALIYNGQLEEFRLTTDLAATQAQKLLTRHIGTEITQQEVEQRLAKYEWDADDLYGLDEWYTDTYFPLHGDDHISNVYLEPSTEITDELAYEIAVTEALDPLFGALSDSLDRSAYIGRHNIFLVTVNGLYRQYPYLPNDFTPLEAFADLPELVAASPEENPERHNLWTLPNLDFDFQGAVFVGNVVPIYDGDDYMGVMVHDLDLSGLAKATTGLKIGDKGLAFVMDNEGYVLMHHRYNPTEIWQNTDPATQEAILASDEEINAWYEEHVDIQAEAYYPGIQPVVGNILDAATVQGMETIQHDGEEWVIAYHFIPETGWYLVTMQPHAELIETAAVISERVQRAGAIMIAIVLAASVLLARRITRPVADLSETAREIEQHVDSETADVIQQNIQRLGNIGTVLEIDNLARVFRQMVFALHSRMRELDSIYTMGQTITSNVEYEETLASILNAVRQIVDYDAAEIAIKRGNRLVVDGWMGEAEAANTVSHQYEGGQGLIGQLVNNPQIMYLPVWDEDETFPVESQQFKVQSLLAVPLLHQEKLIGALILFHRQAGHFTEDAKRQLSKLSAQASIAIENAVQVKTREDSLKQQILELRVAIDDSQREEAVGEISESDFFKDLQQSARTMRRQVTSQDQDEPGQEQDE